jgi:hypothetical protein
MSHFKKILSLGAVFVLLGLVGLASETKAQAVTDTASNNAPECVKEGEIAHSSVSSEDQTKCCEGLESMHPYYYEEDSTKRITGSGFLCYDPNQGIPECLEKDNTTAEAWYYSEGDLLREFECRVDDDDEEEKEDEEGEDLEINDGQERERILNVEQMRYYKNIVKRGDGSLYGIRKDQELIDRIEGNNRAEEAIKEEKTEKERERIQEQVEKENKAKEMVQERKEEIEKIRRNVDNLIKETNQNLKQKIQELQSKLAEKDELIEKQQEKINYVAEVLRGQEDLSDNIKVALSEFISKGTNDNSEKIGEGERLAVLNSYKYAFGHLPQDEDEIEDAIKISNGRFPSKVSETAENRAKIEFKKIYKREVDINNPNDSAALNIMAYGLKQKAQDRNLNSELRGINIFEDIYGHKPQNTQEWNTMQAITYSGAKR